MNQIDGGSGMEKDRQTPNQALPGSIPVRRHAEVNRCSWDPMRSKWQIQGQLIVEYDGDTGEEYVFTLEDGPDGYHVIDESSGPIPESERYWLRKWAGARKAQLYEEDYWW
jgi:hypothetical protein